MKIVWLWLLRSEFMDMEFEICRYAQDKNPNPHFHESYEMLISLNNEGKFFVRENGYQLRFGTIFMLAPYEIHRCFCHGSQDYDRYVIHYSKETLKKMTTKSTDLVSLFESAPRYLQVQDDVLAEILGTLAYLSKPLQIDPEYGEDIERNIRFESFLLMLAKLINTQEEGNPPMVECEARVNEIIHYIHENYNSNISLENLSKEFFVSKSRLSQIFKDATGFSIGDYIITYRIKRACSFLQSGMRVQDVSEAVGFRTSTHFIRTFKKRMDCSPGEFAKKTE